MAINMNGLPGQNLVKNIAGKAQGQLAQGTYDAKQSQQGNYLPGLTDANNAITNLKNAAGGPKGPINQAANQIQQPLQQSVTDQTNLNTATTAAGDAAQQKYQGDVADFNKSIPMYRGQALGNMVARGLSSSIDPNNTSTSSGALGSMDMNRFNQNVGDTLGNMADSYNQFQGNLGLQQQARSQALQNFLNNQGYFMSYQNQQKPGLSDFMGIGAGVAGLI